MCQHPEEIVRALRAESGPRFRSGWWIAANEQTGESRPEAYLMPASDDWADIYPAPTWWQAMATALRLSRDLPDCEYMGGPDGVHG